MLKLTEEEKANIEDVYNTNGSKKFVAQTFGQGKVDKEQTIMKYLEGLSEPKPEPEEEKLTAKTKATIDKLLASDYAIDDIPTTLQASAPMKLLIEEYIESRLLSDPQKQQVDMCLKINQPIELIVQMVASEEPEGSNVRAAVMKYAERRKREESKQQKPGESPSSFNVSRPEVVEPPRPRVVPPSLDKHRRVQIVHLKQAKVSDEDIVMMITEDPNAPPPEAVWEFLRSL